MITTMSMSRLLSRQSRSQSMHCSWTWIKRERCSHAQFINSHSQRRQHHRHGNGLPLKNNRAFSDFLHVHPKVSSALSKGEAVVALESTIVTHGMPYPKNLRTAEAVEQLVLQTGGIPATIAALEGKLHIGLTEDQLQCLATTPHAVKTSRRDLAWVLCQRAIGGTTVSATMIGAHMAGIPIFVTGGVGGVHKGGEASFDISADLVELGRTPVAVISAGVKSILDIPRTLEFLETQGVTVATFGSSSEFPAFFTRHSGVKSPFNIKTPREGAELIDTNLSMDLGSGILIAVPIPEEFAADGEAIEGAIQKSVAEASQQGIQGKDVTPFILQRVNDLTAGRSLDANVALIKNNARVGSQIACELADIRRKKQPRRSSAIHHNGSMPGKRNFSTLEGISRDNVCRRRHYCTSSQGRPVVIGASIVDHTASVRGQELVYGGATNVGAFHVSYGGVGRNLADALTRLGANPIFLSAIGTDFAGKALQSNCSHMDFSRVSLRDDVSTATYCLVLEKTGEVVIGIGDMEINSMITPAYISQHIADLKQAPLVCMDGNIPIESINFISAFCSEHAIPLWFEPTCVMKAVKGCRSDAWKSLTYASPNFNELRTMYAAIKGEEIVKFQDELSFTDKLQECLQLCRVLLRHVYCLVITLGEDGVLVCRNAEPEDRFIVDPGRLNLFLLDDLRLTMQEMESEPIFSAVHYPVSPIADKEGDIVSVSGAGDCFAAALMASMLRGHPSDLCLKSGLLAAQRSLQSHHAVPESVDAKLLVPRYVTDRMTLDPSRLL